eukprot:m.196271 g.196271  ORF g.196271 m.196271 type:complete len:540 (-) comp14906_c0_seq1:363-1982(-)
MAMMSGLSQGAIPGSQDGPTPDPCINIGDTAWVVTATFLVLGMIPGLALFEAGLLRSKNTISVLTQVMAGCVMMAVLWYLIGFSFVFGDSLGGFIGSPASYPALVGAPRDSCFPGQRIPGLAYTTFQMMFASITPLLMTGAFAERLLWKPFVAFVVLWELLVYYPVAHWIWGKGWLADHGVLDYAGGIVIHVTAGAASLVSAIVVHPRPGFQEAHGLFEPSNIPIAVVGGAFLWMGWFGFNAGSALTSGWVAASVIANTQVASTTASCMWLLLAWLHGKPNVEDILNGAICGLAGITPAAGYVSTQTALVLGAVLGVSSYYSIGLIKYRLHIDDALTVSSVHGLPGIVGALATGLAAQIDVNPYVVTENGVIFGGKWSFLGWQALAIVVVAIYTAVITLALLKLIQLFTPLSSLHLDDPTHDERGLDAIDHEFAAYSTGHTWIGDDVEGGVRSRAMSHASIHSASINSSGSSATVVRRSAAAQPHRSAVGTPSSLARHQLTHKAVVEVEHDVESGAAGKASAPSTASSANATERTALLS